jgi:undecaprenyl-diphosphatase
MLSDAHTPVKRAVRAGDLAQVMVNSERADARSGITGVAARKIPELKTGSRIKFRRNYPTDQYAVLQWRGSEWRSATNNRIVMSLAPLAGAPPSHCAGVIDTTFASLGPAKVALLGVVQGVSELLPISSTAHMRAVPALLGWPDPGSAFSAAMQLAALTAVIAYFRADIEALVRGSVTATLRRDWANRELKLAVAIVLATIPIGIAGLLLTKVLNQCGSPLRTPMVVGIACVAMALLMGWAELAARHKRTADKLSLWDALLIGVAQVGALVPGFSRSGSTLTAALALGFKREDAARVSFLLGIPAIALAGGREIFLLHRAGLSSQGWEVLAIGLVVSSASAYLAIWGLMRLLERFSTWPLVIYRALFGIVLAVGAAMHWIA